MRGRRQAFLCPPRRQSVDVKDRPSFVLYRYFVQKVLLVSREERASNRVQVLLPRREERVSPFIEHHEPAICLCHVRDWMTSFRRHAGRLVE